VYACNGPGARRRSRSIIYIEVEEIQVSLSRRSVPADEPALSSYRKVEHGTEAGPGDVAVQKEGSRAGAAGLLRSGHGSLLSPLQTRNAPPLAARASSGDLQFLGAVVLVLETVEVLVVTTAGEVGLTVGIVGDPAPAS